MDDVAIFFNLNNILRVIAQHLREFKIFTLHCVHRDCGIGAPVLAPALHGLEDGQLGGVEGVPR
jgi:hypothetical protein